MKLPVALLLTLTLVTACASGPNKSELDAEVKRLCAIDGGMKVYETVVLPASRFDKYGDVLIPIKERAKPSDEFYYDWILVYYRKGNPEMWRNNFKVYRQSDHKLLGESVSYARRGGDVIGPWHDSSFLCPEKSGVTDLKRRIFINRLGDNQ